MSEQKFPEDVPASYRDLHGVPTLSDTDEPPITDAVRKDARVFAESSVQAVQSLIFPTHGLKT